MIFGPRPSASKLIRSKVSSNSAEASNMVTIDILPIYFYPYGLCFRLALTICHKTALPVRSAIHQLLVGIQWSLPITAACISDFRNWFARADFDRPYSA